MITRDSLIFLAEADRMFSNDDPGFAPDPYFRTHGERWRTALSSDRLRVMRDLYSRGELPDPWRAELESVLSALGLAS